MNLWTAIFTIGIVCTIYTTLGGLKAVIWTDVFQGAVVIVMLIVTLFMSADSIGGWHEVWRINHDTNRFVFNDFDFDPRIRHTFWNLIIGLTFLWGSMYATTQSQVQRYLACSSPRKANQALVFSMLLIALSLLLCLLIGLVTYAYFHNCDPLMTREVSSADQLVPLMVLRIFRNQPGLSGAFLAAVFAGSLSTVSSGINAMACVTSEDFIRPFVKWSDRTMTILAKVLVLLYGLLTIGFACLSSILGNVLQTTLTLLAVIGGPTLGIYTLGIVFPPANSYGTFSGFVVGLAIITWIYAGSQRYRLPVQFLKPKYRSVSGCPVPVTDLLINSTMEMMTSIPVTSEMEVFNTTAVPQLPGPEPRPPLADFYSVSYTSYAPIGFGITLVVGLIISLLTGGHRNVKHVDPKLIVPLFDHPILKSCLPKSFRKMMWCGVDHDKVDDKTDRIPANDILKHKNGQENPTFEAQDELKV
uniref:sodium-coupled monocarboxylate transporter 2-like n=1 Tax=Styela clava TaxID=7725 RepID=UPI00193A8167|nr:sodium-coupled monocarboxylate transporter 2-like [Styela clava]